MSTEELKQFYKAKAKKPDLYTYDDDGNLTTLNKEGTVIKTIALPNYRSPTQEEYDEMEKTRIEAIAVANREYEDARKELRELNSRPDTLESEILRINRKVIEADIKLQSVRFPLKYVGVDDGIQISKIDFDQLNEKRKYPYEFYFLQERPFTLQEQYVRIGRAAEKPLISVAEANAMAAAMTAPPVILFANPDTNEYGYLSLNWAVELEFNGTMYNSATQALAAELAKAFNDQDNLSKIMIADSPDAINYKLSDVPGDADINETKWNDLTKQLIFDINIAKFNQYPELAGRLLETKGARLGAYIPDDNLLGIGISLDNIQSKNYINWTGQNLLGKALMDIRDKLQTEREMALQQQATVAQPAPRRKKPAPAVLDPGANPSVAGVPPGAVPRPVRRRPQVAAQVEASLAATAAPTGEEGNTLEGDSTA